MRDGAPNLVWLRTFETAARLLNFTEAGRELGLTQTAVSQHIKALEGTLGCRLFDRKPRNMELTAMGRAYFHSVRNALADIDRATTSLFGPDARKTVTVRAPISTAGLWLAPLLPEFKAAHPHIHVRLISTIWADSVSAAEVDVDLRFGYGNWPGVQVEKISTETIVPVRAVDDPDPPVGPEDLLTRPLIHILGHEYFWDLYCRPQGLKAEKAKVAYSVDTSIAAFALVAEGAGYAVILNRYAEAAAKSGRGIVPAGEAVSFPQSHWLAQPNAQAELKPEVLVFREWLKAQFASAQLGPDSS